MIEQNNWIIMSTKIVCFWRIQIIQPFQNHKLNKIVEWNILNESLHPKLRKPGWKWSWQFCPTILILSLNWWMYCLNKLLCINSINSQYGTWNLLKSTGNSHKFRICFYHLTSKQNSINFSFYLPKLKGN